MRCEVLILFWVRITIYDWGCVLCGSGRRRDGCFILEIGLMRWSVLVLGVTGCGECWGRVCWLLAGRWNGRRVVGLYVFLGVWSILRWSWGYFCLKRDFCNRCCWIDLRACWFIVDLIRVREWLVVRFCVYAYKVI